MSEDEHREDLRDLAAELQRSEVAKKILTGQLAQHIERETIMVRALNMATVLIDQLLSDLRVAGGTPSIGLLNAKMNFDQAMKRLLGEERVSVEVELPYKKRS